MTRVLVTGVAGFIGSHVAEHCLALGFDVVGIDDLSGGFVENVPTGVDFRKGSVCDAEWIAAIWQEKPFDFVYHLAAYAAEGLSHFIRRFNYETNLIGSINLINQSVLHNVKCFVFTSSIAVYGANQTPMHEALTPRPEDPYGISKYAVELDLEAAHRMFGLPYIIFRPHNVYGERQNIADKYRNVIGIFMNQVMQNQPMTIFGDGLQTRAFSHVDDVAPVIARSPLVTDAYGEVFNIGADEPYTVLELARQVAAAFGVDPSITHLPARNEVVNAYADHEKARRVFSLNSPVSLETGIQRMVEWVKAHGPMAPVEFKDIEVPVNLPSSWVKHAKES
ncbi:MAG TPA: UDP-glucose 4-epimerase [Chloroflexi bacterium]|nr:UDP-glucose 4-epimerase [Chloroflexota bacterium]HHW87785.1 NAD-dependent epimerase/dehydratase family protein [Chloroflexota bacterium]